ncbi:YchJ family protein [Spartinivicinus ruber]|uniref:YchJ family protein n=1 Tax=Spartinivicinus ruber TaxID=2683272 RepID=UPI0013D416F0|nr:YchJ family protein [Spartinivicinus ruber]
MNNPVSCPCGSNQDFTSCCQPFIEGSQSATTAEQLMRSRYSAYSVHALDYLIATTHPDQQANLEKQAIKSWADQCHWVRLEVKKVSAGQASDDAGEVSFNAYYQLTSNPKTQVLSENSRFVKINQHWYYIDPTVPFKIKGQTKINRNDPCPCGSGKKYKKCCLNQQP